MNENNITVGEVFSLSTNNGTNKLWCIQNFIGMHTTKFPEDFDRNMKKLLGNNNNNNNNIVGVVNSHDYDLDFTNTLNCIRYQMNFNNVDFCSFGDLISEESKAVSNIRL